LKGGEVKVVAVSVEPPSPHTRQSKTAIGGPNQCSYKEIIMSRKRAFSEEIGGATALKSLPTPIGLFEDECVFCHSFRTSQVIQLNPYYTLISVMAELNHVY
jgi:BRCA1-associated RING domain protein 1